ncbi:substrate-binding periplasmic protein [Thalassotalea castellviae]|uniref:ABC transporter substrate-binding protein n=1 Tax=Thalassotalea castellviae TaxID=3075612 RepID=A0ABU2ZYI7_9GAMM|nr:ABC transporter substrate-binding protein [Thalassotalea sp. W431]MDT0602703.1 ABC transporter substrate-binding protein [Thalassotalea sp. W431]
MLRFMLFCSCLFTLLAKADEQLLFVVNDPGSLPYLYFDHDQNSYIGVIPDILHGMQSLNYRFVSNSRKRSEEQIYANKADMMMLSVAWLKQPEKVISTIPIHQHRSFLYSPRKFPENFSLAESKKINTVCTRKSYFYPKLNSYFDSKRLMRVDASNHLSMLKMLFKKRCDYLVMNEFNAINIMQLPFFEGKQLYHAKQPISSVPLNIILRPEFTREKQLLDEHIRALQESGEMDKLLAKYTYTHRAKKE